MIHASDLWLGLLMAGLLASLFAALARVVVGPSLPDRIVAFDLVTVLAVAFTGLVAWRFQAPALLDMAIVLALVAFVATIAFADHLIRREEDP